MSLSSSLNNVGHPVAYYPRLARFFGSVNVAILFAQLYYWQQREQRDIGVYKTSEALEEETGLSYREQVTARKSLRAAGFLVETHRRLEHRVYYRLELEVVDTAFDEWTNAQSANDENAIREQRQTQSENDAKRSPGAAESSPDELRQTQSVINTETTKETTAETTADILSTTAVAAVAGASGVALDAERKEAFAALCRKTWEAYADAYFGRYATEAVRNAKANATVVNLVKRLGAEAPEVAQFFVERVSEAFVVRRCHGIGDLLAQCEAFRTQWASGMAVTAEGARQADRTASNANAAQGAAEKAMAIVAARRAAAEAQGGNHAG